METFFLSLEKKIDGSGFTPSYFPVNSYLYELPFHRLTGEINFGYDLRFGQDQDLEIFQPKNEVIH
jgi:hypothetical protein